MDHPARSTSTPFLAGLDAVAGPGLSPDTRSFDIAGMPLAITLERRTWDLLAEAARIEGMGLEDLVGLVMARCLAPTPPDTAPSGPAPIVPAPLDPDPLDHTPPGPDPADDGDQPLPSLPQSIASALELFALAYFRAAALGEIGGGTGDGVTSGAPGVEA